MAKDHRRLAEEVAQGILLDDPTFLKEIVERVLQEFVDDDGETQEHDGQGQRVPERQPPAHVQAHGSSRRL